MRPTANARVQAGTPDTIALCFDANWALSITQLSSGAIASMDSLKSSCRYSLRSKLLPLQLTSLACLDSHSSCFFVRSPRGTGANQTLFICQLVVGFSCFVIFRPSS
jgi:hypothetical protein